MGFALKFANELHRLATKWRYMFVASHFHGPKPADHVYVDLEIHCYFTNVIVEVRVARPMTSNGVDESLAVLQVVAFHVGVRRHSGDFLITDNEIPVEVKAAETLQAILELGRASLGDAGLRRISALDAPFLHEFFEFPRF